MRSVDRLIRSVCLGAACAALSACAMFDKAAAPAGGAPAEAKAAPAAAIGKEAAAPGTKSEMPPISPSTQRAYDTARQALAAGRTADAERGFVALNWWRRLRVNGYMRLLVTKWWNAMRCRCMATCKRLGPVTKPTASPGGMSR